MLDVAQRIKDLCDERKINSMYELAKLSGVPQSTLSTIMAGSSPRTDTLEKICQGLGITMADFFIDDKTKKLISKDLFPVLLEIIKSLDLPAEIKDAALQKFESLSENKKLELLPQLVKSMRVAEDGVYYSVDGSLTGIINKYKNLPEEHRKALALIIDSLHHSH